MSNTIEIPADLFDAIRAAFNQLPNRRVDRAGYANTYSIAVALGCLAPPEHANPTAAKERLTEALALAEASVYAIRGRLDSSIDSDPRDLTGDARRVLACARDLANVLGTE